MRSLRHIFVRVSILVLGLTPILEAQQQTATGGPIFCPPWNMGLSPSLLDVLIRPGLTGG